MKQAKSIFLVFLAINCFNLSNGQKLNENLDKGREVLRSIEKNTEHYFELTMEKGEFALVNLEQKGIDLMVITYDPNEKKIEEFDSPNGSFGNELIVIDAYKSGKYLIKILPLGEIKKEKKGSYAIKLISQSNSIVSHLDKNFELIGKDNYLPGFFVSILNDEKILYTNGQGFANIKDQKPYTIHTIQQIESISKTFLGLSVMLLVEQGKLDLDKDINEYLPFKVNNPFFTEEPITIRHLATHTAAISDRDDFHQKFYWIENKDVFSLNKNKYIHKERRKFYKSIFKNKKLSMEDFIKSYLVSNGKNYSKKNFLKQKPSTAWFYSNIGATLAAYIVQLVSEQSYDNFVEEHIIDALKLKHTTWGYNLEKQSFNALKYGGGKYEYPRITGPTYPDGGIYSNTIDLANYLMHWIKGYSGESTLLKKSSYQDIMKIQFEEKKGKYKGVKNGLFWWIFGGNRMGSNGGDMGSNSNMFFNPKLGVGYTSLQNVQSNESDGGSIQTDRIKKILNRYLKFFSVDKE